MLELYKRAAGRVWMTSHPDALTSYTQFGLEPTGETFAFEGVTGPQLHVVQVDRPRLAELLTPYIPALSKSAHEDGVPGGTFSMGDSGIS